MPHTAFHVKRDLQLSSAVQSAINSSPDVDALAVRVSSVDGIVLLEGQVGSYAERVGAGELAEGVAGLDAVENRLTVRSFGGDWDISDETIRTSVQTALADNIPDSPLGSIQVLVDCHVVTLTGTVASFESRSLIRHTVEAVRGVDFVDNQIAVSDSH